MRQLHWIGLSGAVLAFGAGLGALAADKPAKPSSAATASLPNSPPTEVSALIVDGRTVVPKVGAGAPLYTVEELKAAEATARKGATTARFAADQCAGGMGQLVRPADNE